uniref:Formin-H-like n=1 Tax=Xenopus tropicalis TaxID=8364 RepID=A0A803JGK0_XENTR
MKDSNNKLSQEEIAEIMKKVKNREISVEEAVELTKTEGKVQGEEPKLCNSESPSKQQYNFTVYKFRYRWQKRILQIDFYSEMIFNIEKGTLKKQFPFSQIKACKKTDDLKFVISFYGHQDYELEAACREDKESIMKIMNDIIQRNDQTSHSQSYAKKHAYSDVLLEGILELAEPNSDTWVKNLVKMKKEELIFYSYEQKTEPLKNTLTLSDCHVTPSPNGVSPSFTLKSGGHSYMFRIPLNKHTQDPENRIKERDDWVALLQKQCAQSQQCPAHQEEPPSDAGHLTNNHTEPLLYQELHIYSQVKRGPRDCNETNIYNELSFRSTSPNKEVLSPSAGFLIPPSRPAPPPPPPPILFPSVQRDIIKKTKAFHWDVVPNDKIKHSMWSQAASDPKILDTQRIMFQFQTQDKPVATDMSLDNLKNQQIILNVKVAHNFSIVLKGFNMEPWQLKDKLLIIHERDGGLSDENLTNLRRYIPTLKDKNTYLALKSPPSELHIVDQFMLEMCKIPDLGPKLDVLLAIREVPMYMKDIHPLLCHKIQACQQLLKSQSFSQVLKYILAIGNFLNENAGKESAKGFRLSSLLKMSHLMSKEKRFTLTHALVEQILLQEPDLASFSQELTEFEAVPGASVKGLTAEVDVTAKELEKINQYRKTFKSKLQKGAANETQFLKDLTNILKVYQAQQEELSKKSCELKKLYSEVLQKFGEEDDQDSQELFGWVSSFIKEFKNAHSAVRSAQMIPTAAPSH